MVTLQDIQQRENDLNVVEKKASAATETKIPQRRYGVGVTRSDQKAAYAQRQEGKRVLGEVNSQRQQLGVLKQEVVAYNNQQAQIAAIQKQQSDYNLGVRIGLNGGFPWFANKEVRQGYRDALDQLKYNEQRTAYNKQISDLKAQGLTPVTDNKGNVIAFSDSNRMQSIPLQSIPSLPQSDLIRYEKAGVVTLEKPGNLPPNSVVSNNMGGYSPTDSQGNILSKSVPAPVLQSKVTPKPYQPFFGKIETAIEYPFNKAAEFYIQAAKGDGLYNKAVNAIYGGPNDFPKYKPGVAGGRVLVTQSTDINQTTGPYVIRTAGEIAAFPVYGAKQIERFVFDPSFRQDVFNLPLGQKALLATNIVLSVGVASSLTKKGFNFLKEPIRIKEEIKIPEQYFSETELKTIKINDKVLNVAKFEVTSISPAQRAYEVPRLQAALMGLRKNDVRLLSTSLEDLQLNIPGGKIVEVRPLKVTKSITEPFIVDNGRIVRALERPGEPGVLSMRGTYYMNGNTRVTSRTLSILSGENYDSQVLKTLSKGRTELPANTQKALSELEKINSNIEGVNLKKLFDKKLKLETGGVRVEDILKINNKGFKTFPEGKTISRGEVATIQERISKITLDNNPKGLNQIEIFNEQMGVVDTTFPRIRTPKKAIKIEGKLTKLEYELPAGKDLGKTYSSGTKTKLEFDSSLDQKTIQKAIGDVAVKQSKGAVPRKLNLPKISQVEVPTKEITTSAFAGTGLYERTESNAALLPPAAKQVPGLVMNTKLINKPFLGERGINKQINKNLNKEISKEILKNVPKEITKQVPKLVNKQVNKQINKQIVKTVQKNVPKIVPLAPNFNPPKSPPPSKPTKTKIPSLDFKKNKKVTSLVPGYKPYVIKGGKKTFLKGIFSKGVALFKGETEALNSLRATFGIEKANKKVENKNIKFSPSRKFRSYRIVKGKKVKLKNEFIQKRGTRLSSFGEVKDIQLAKMKNGGFKI